MARGNYKQPIFFVDDDRVVFLAFLSRASRRHAWEVLAYCLMTTHYHLVLRTPFAGLSDGMRLLNGGYSRQIHRRLERTGEGHLFQNRFLGEPLIEAEHLYEACRYVVLNPVRAGLCRHAGEWTWSSYRACAGLELPPGFLASGELLNLFGPDPETAQQRYCEFVAAGVSVSDTVAEV